MSGKRERARDFTRTILFATGGDGGKNIKMHVEHFARSLRMPSCHTHTNAHAATSWHRVAGSDAYTAAV